MNIIDKIKIRRIERKWKKYGRKDYFTWVHRYFRLHKELIEDDIYKEIYEYTRNTLIKYYKRDVKRKDTSDKEYGELIDVLADIFNKTSADRVDKLKKTVERLYDFWVKHPDLKKEIRI